MAYSPYEKFLELYQAIKCGIQGSIEIEVAGSLESIHWIFDEVRRHWLTVNVCGISFVVDIVIFRVPAFSIICTDIKLHHIENLGCKSDWNSVFNTIFQLV